MSGSQASANGDHPRHECLLAALDASQRHHPAAVAALDVAAAERVIAKYAALEIGLAERQSLSWEPPISDPAGRRLIGAQ